MTATRDHQTLTPLFNRPFALTDDEWGTLAQSPHVCERFGLTGANTDAETLIRGAYGTYAARFDIDDYHAVYVLQDSALAQPPLVLTRDGDGRLCPTSCPDHDEPHVPRPIL